MAANREVYVLGGYMTDFARNWTKENKHFSALMRESVLGALERTGIAPEEVAERPRRQLRRRALLHAGPPRRVLHRGAPGVQRPAHLAPRGGVRVGQHRAARGRRRDRGGPLRPPGRRRHRADEDGLGRAGRQLPRHGRLVRPRGQGRRVPVPEAVRPARRRVRQALRAEGRAPRRDQQDQLREREEEPERADAHLVHEQGARALPHGRQPGGGRADPDRGLLAGDRRCGVRVPGLARVRGEVRQGHRAQARPRSRASRAGATTRRACASTTRSPRARATATCFRTCAARSPTR